MPTVSAVDRIFTRAPHHRRPRSAAGAAWVDAEPVCVNPSMPGPGAPYTVPCASPQPSTISWPDAAHTGRFGAWTIGDGVYGRADGPTSTITDRVGDRATTVAAWYYPAAVVDDTGGAGERLVDELLLTTQTLLDDDFVTVVGDPALTSQANTDGWVSTASARQLQARPTIGLLQFDRWLFLGAGSPTPIPGQTQFDVAAGTSGVALAAYLLPILDTVPSGVPPYVPHLVLDEAVALQAVRNHPPADPLGGTLAQLAANALIRDAASSLNATTAGEVAKLLDVDAQRVLADGLKRLEPGPGSTPADDPSKG